MATRSATVRSFAKINLDLRVLHRRPDGFHELRTVFQTVSLADTLRIDFERARRTELSIAGNIDIPDNLVTRAAQAVLDTARLTGRVSFTLRKRIPMGAGLGGGSSNGAAVLLALPALAGVSISEGLIAALAAALGSDVPFFLQGGTAVGIGRGTELFPLADPGARWGVLAAPGVHVSTAEAYRDLGRKLPDTLTTAAPDFDTDTFQSLVWGLADKPPTGQWTALCANDFESVVFRRHPVLRAIKRKLMTLGARPALMTGSGSALFGLFDSGESAATAHSALSGLQEGGDAQVFRIELLSRRRYRALWRKQLAAHITAEPEWPPRTRYSKP